MEKEFNDFLEKENAYVNDDGVISYYNGDSFERTCDIYPIARHFYKLRNRALEEAAQHVYESWMGGTMDDVRRDMVELGRVINARKEE